MKPMILRLADAALEADMIAVESGLEPPSPYWGEDVAVAVLRRLRDCDHDMTATVVAPGQIRTEAVRMFQAMIDVVIAQSDQEWE